MASATAPRARTPGPGKCPAQPREPQKPDCPCKSCALCQQEQAGTSQGGLTQSMSSERDPSYLTPAGERHSIVHMSWGHHPWGPWGCHRQGTAEPLALSCCPRASTGTARSRGPVSTGPQPWGTAGPSPDTAGDPSPTVRPLCRLWSLPGSLGALMGYPRGTPGC